MDCAESSFSEFKNKDDIYQANLKTPNFFSYHCILHQEQLCSKLRSGKVKVIMDSVTRTINFILAHALKHRQFRPLVKEFESAYVVRWLRRGNVLHRFMELLPAVRTFLVVKGRPNLLAPLEVDTFILSAAFLTDLTRQLN